MRLRTLATLGLALLVLLPVTGSAQQDERTAARWFEVSWTLTPALGGPTIRGQVQNRSPHRVTNVELQIEGLDADDHLLARTRSWAYGDIGPGATTFFVAEAIPRSVKYRIRVVSWDLVSAGEAP